MQQTGAEAHSVPALVGNFLTIFFPWKVEDPGLVVAFSGDF